MALNDRMMVNTELEKMCKEAIIPYVRYCSGWGWGLRKSKNLQRIKSP
jgi:hypothetical protein